MSKILDLSRLQVAHEDYITMTWRWKKMRLILAGEDAVRMWDISGTRGVPDIKTFLLKPIGQEQSKYEFLVYNTRFFNITARTAEVLLGLLYYRDPVAKVPNALDPIILNVDLAGTTLAEFSKKVALDAITIGRGGILVDYPRKMKEEMTVQEAEENNYRPFLRYYTAEQIFNWEYSVINNVKTLTRVLIDESETTGKRNVIRELELRYSDETQSWEYHNTLYAVADEAMFSRTVKDIRTSLFKTKSIVPGTVLSEGTPLNVSGEPFNAIPFMFTGPMYDQFEIQKAPLSDIADLNVEHYRKSAWISSALYHCAHPTPIFAGFQFQIGQQVALGSDQGVSTNDANAHASYLELTGQSVNELRKERDAVMRELASLGARLLTATNDATETAETSRIKASGDTSVMNTLTSSFDRVFTQLITFIAQWMGVSEEGISISFNKEFMPYRLTAQDVTALLSAVVQNKMSQEDFVEIMQTGGIIRQSRSIKDYIAALPKETEGDDGTDPVENPSAGKSSAKMDEIQE